LAQTRISSGFGTAYFTWINTRFVAANWTGKKSGEIFLARLIFHPKNRELGTSGGFLFRYGLAWMFSDLGVVKKPY